MTVRRALLKVHIWVGILLGAFWLLQGVTGAVLVFNRDVQATYLDSGPRADRLPLDRLLDRAGTAIGARVTRLETFGPDPMLLLAYHETSDGERVAVIDARTGDVFDRRDMNARLPSGGETWPWLLRFHESLLAGESGLIIVGCSGVLLFSSLVVGLWNALPYRSWRQARRMTQMRGSRQRLVGWHRLVGLLAAPALIATVACGIYLAFAPQLRPILAKRAGYQMPYKPLPQATPPAINISAEQAYQAARTRFPGATLVRLSLPSAKAPVYLFRMLQPDDARRWAGTSTIAVDPATGAIIDAYDSRTGPIANRITDGIYSVHTGDLAGAVGRVLMLLTGLALPLFAITGWVSWGRRRRRVA